MTSKNDTFIFAPESHSDTKTPVGDPWHVLIVDDDNDIIKVSHRILSDLTFEGKACSIVSCHSGIEAIEILNKNNNFHLVLLDVSMETDEAGLDVVNYIRNTLKNQNIRILLRTGQAGQFDEEEVFERYDINDFLEKAELTSRRLRTAIKVALRSYRMQDEINQNMINEIQLRKKADIANQAKSEFLANMSHELRSPLTSIKSGLSIISEIINNPDTDDEDQKDLLKSIQYAESSSTRLLLLINDILDLSKLETSNLSLNFDENNLNDLITLALHEISSQATLKSLTLIFDKPDINTNICIDANRIMQVLINLLQNAVKFSTEGKKINISVKHSLLPIGSRKTDTQTQEALSIIVSDEGIGIPNNELNLIFDKFSQSTKTKDGSGGTGLGLAIVKNIVERHNGVITAENNEQVGARFIITLPKGNDHE